MYLFFKLLILYKFYNSESIFIFKIVITNKYLHIKINLY